MEQANRSGHSLSPVLATAKCSVRVRSGLWWEADRALLSKAFFKRRILALAFPWLSDAAPLSEGEVLLDNEERKEMQRLCTLIQSEQNPAKVSALLEQLNVLLEHKEKRLVEKLRGLASQSQAPGLLH